MPNYCSYYNCKNITPNISMFRFPVHDEDRLLMWIRNSGNTSLVSLTREKLGRRCICVAHFPPSHVFQGTLRNRLIGRAVPIHFQCAEIGDRTLTQTKAHVDMETDAPSEPPKLKTQTSLYRRKAQTSSVKQTNGKRKRSRVSRSKRSGFFVPINLKQIKQEFSTTDSYTHILDDTLSISPTKLIEEAGHTIRDVETNHKPSLNKEMANDEMMPHVPNLKVEDSDDVEVAGLRDGNNVNIERLPIEKNIMYGNREQVEDSTEESDTEKMKLEALDNTDGELLKGAAATTTCELQRPTHARTQHTTTLHVQNDTTIRETVVGEIDSSDNNGHIEGNAIEYYIRQIAECTTRYCTVALKKINISVTNEHSAAEYICDVCGDIFTRKNHLIRHLKSHNAVKDNHSKDNLKPYECDMCKKRFGNKGLIRRHMRRHSSKKPFECGICEKKFKTAYNFHKHSTAHPEKKTFQCPKCQKYFKSKNSLERHLRTRCEDNTYFECIICCKEFYTKRHLEYHLLTHFRQKSIECETCGKTFKTIRGLQTHCNTTHAADKKFFPCTMCRYKFTQKRYLERHLSKSHNVECPICDKVIKKKGDLKKHLKFHSGIKRFECAVCQKKFVEPGGLRRHLITHSDKKPFECKLCGRAFNLKSNLKKHLRTHSEETPFECPTCLRRFRYETLLKLHLKVHDMKKEKLFECEICQKRFEKKTVLARHLTIHSEKKPFKCKICLKSFKYEISRHLKTHSKDRLFECAVCQKRYKSKKDLLQHIITHSGEKPFECGVCQKRFYTNSELKHHSKIHTGEKPFECAICQKRFRDRGGLKEHLSRHALEKAYKCEICQKKFSTKADLKQHLTRHVGKKGYKCEICRNSFCMRSDLISHLRRHTGEKRHECEICRKRFYTGGELTEHLRGHTREKLFKCEICQKKFCRKSNLRQHLKTHRTKDTNKNLI